ncbi:MAG: D-hexose-6-phosphate mutarotase [Planctomycetota bacterium]
MDAPLLDRADEFNLPHALKIEAGEGGLPRLVVATENAAAHQYLHGATLTHWQPAGQAPVLFTSAEAVYDGRKAIRGGVPVCFPWFGPHPSDPDAPAHGLARTRPWQLTRTAADARGVETRTVLHVGPLQIEQAVVVGPTLEARYTVTNPSDTDQRFELALHTYLALGDIHQASVTGLEHAEYLDQLTGEIHRQPDAPITFTAETDRVYRGTDATCTLHDPALGRRVVVEKLGGRSTVVWNPWIDKSARTADLGDDEWTRFCCIESACIGDDAVTLAPGQRHTLAVTLRVEAA